MEKLFDMLISLGVGIVSNFAYDLIKNFLKSSKTNPPPINGATPFESLPTLTGGFFCARPFDHDEYIV